MSNHIRQQVREAVATVLSATPTAWNIVVESRVQSTRQIWPYLMVYSDGDTAEAISIDDPVIYERTCRIVIVGMLRMPSAGEVETIEDRMDELSLEIETKLTNSALRAQLAKIQSLTMNSTTLEVIVTDDDIIDHAEVTMTYDVVCANAENAPSTLI